MLQSRAWTAHVNPPSLHDFRRAFALLMLRAGTDVITLSRLMGHSDLEILKIYLKQNDDDLQRAHDKASLIDEICSCLAYESTRVRRVEHLEKDRRNDSCQ